MLTIGSIVKHHARLDALARAALAVVRHLRRLVELAADAVTDEVAHHPAALRLDVLLDRRADVAEARAVAHLGDAELERAARDLGRRAAPRRAACRCRTCADVSPWKPSRRNRGDVDVDDVAVA